MKRSKFSLSHYKLFSCDMGELIPCGLIEVLPGDTFDMATSLLVRASPLLSPVMHPVQVRLHHWFVPWRLIWDEFEDFITAGPDGLNVSTYPFATSSGGHSVGSLPDYLGVPPSVASLEYSMLPFRAYALIFNEWYRDQDLVAASALSTASGADSTTSRTLRSIAWEKDYFTSARPWEQKGPQITIPLGTTAPVLGIGVENLDPTTGGSPTIRKSGVTATGTWPNFWNQDAAPTAGFDLFLEASATGNAGRPNVRADLSTASAITPTALREAFALQRYEENRARFGSRFTEYLRMFGVRSSDARLQRPEYLGGGRQVIQFSEVLQTAEGTDPVGDLKGHGISAVRSNRFRKFFEEHGCIMSLFSVRPKTIYAQGLPRMFSRKTKEDYFQKELQHIGQQPILNQEIYGAAAEKTGTFGYQDRYDEYRRQESSIAGEFRTTLDYWHMARIFASEPALNSSFVTSVPTERTFAVPDSDVLWVMARHSVRARRVVAQTGSSFIY